MGVGVGVAGLSLAGWGVLMCALSATTAQAAEDAFHPFASIGYTRDNNLFRLPDNHPGYDNRREDNLRTLEAGLLFDKTYGRQEFSVQAKTSNVSFDHFKALDYNGKDLAAEWHWRLGSQFDGKAGVQYTQVLAPYTDVITRERNIRVQRHEYLNGNWQVHPSWRVRAGATHDRYRYDLSSQAYSNRNDDVAEAGVDYLAHSGSYIGLQARKLKSRYEKMRTTATGQPLDPGSEQTELKLRMLWKVTGVSELELLGGHAKRTHAFFAERDSSGFNARLQARTLMGGQWSANAALWREFSPVESNIVSYSLNSGMSASAVWAFSSKLQVNASTRYEKRDFKGMLVTAAGLQFDDRTRNHSLGLTYVPYRLVQLNTSVFRQSRSGAPLLGSGGFHANGVSFNVNLQY